MPRLVVPLIFLLFFVFLRPITKARPSQRGPPLFSPYPFLSLSLSLPSDPASSLSPRMTRDLVMMTPARNVQGGPIYRNRESRSLFTFSLNDRVRTNVLSSPAFVPRGVRYFFSLVNSLLSQKYFLPYERYLTNIDSRIRSYLYLTLAR